MIVGASVAYAGWGWWWNAEIELEGLELRTAWTVDGGEDSDAADDYHARIKVSLPGDARATIVTTADQETVVIKKSKGLRCGPNGLQASVQYKARSVEKIDLQARHRVQTRVTLDGKLVGEKSGRHNESITIRFNVPADHPACADSENDSNRKSKRHRYSGLREVTAARAAARSGARRTERTRRHRERLAFSRPRRLVEPRDHAHSRITGVWT